MGSGWCLIQLSVLFVHEPVEPCRNRKLIILETGKISRVLLPSFNRRVHRVFFAEGAEIG